MKDFFRDIRELVSIGWWPTLRIWAYPIWFALMVCVQPHSRMMWFFLGLTVGVAMLCYIIRDQEHLLDWQHKLLVQQHETNESLHQTNRLLASELDSRPIVGAIAGRKPESIQ